MPHRSNAVFSLVDRYRETQLGVNFRALKPGPVTVVESPARLEPLPGDELICALWWVWLADGRSVASVPPGAGGAVADILREAHRAEQVVDPHLAKRIAAPINDLFRRAQRGKISQAVPKLWLACNGALLRRPPCGDCRRLFDDSIPCAPGLELPGFAFREHVVFGVVVHGEVVSIAAALPTDTMEGQVAEIYVETAPHYRMRSHAKAAIRTCRSDTRQPLCSLYPE